MFRIDNGGVHAVATLPAGLVLRADAHMDGYALSLLATHAGGEEICMEDVLDVVLPAPFCHSVYRTPVFVRSVPALANAAAMRLLFAAHTTPARSPLMLTDVSLLPTCDEGEEVEEGVTETDTSSDYGTGDEEVHVDPTVDELCSEDEDGFEED